MSALQDQIKQAQEAAGDVAGQDSAEPGAVVEASVNSAGQVMAFEKPSMAVAAATTGVVPKNIPFLKVNEFGIRVGKDKTFLEEVIGKINMTEDKGFQVKMTVRYGSPAKYISTFDGAVSDKGGSWGDAVKMAQDADPKAVVYHSVDVPVTLTKDLKFGKETLAAGKQVAVNTSKTNWSEWEEFYQACAEKDLLGQDVDVKIAFNAVEHDGNEWGVFTFEIL